MTSVMKASRGQPRTAPPSAGAARDHLSRFREIAAMVASIDRLPDVASLRRRQARGVEPTGQNEELRRAYEGMDPLTRRAFEAVVAGLDKLAQSAVELCDDAERPLTPSEIEACAGIGRSMKQLLKRATALVDSPQPRADRFGRTGAANAMRKPRENKN